MLDLSENRSPTVHIKNLPVVQEKLKRLLAGGTDRLQVISDFDFTITRFSDDTDEPCWTTHGVFDYESKRIDEELYNELRALRAKYMAIEFDPHMCIEEKVPHMQTWWTTAHRLIASAGFTHETLERFVRDSHMLLRRSCQDFLRLLESLDIPLVLFSAGIGDLIDIFLQQQIGHNPSNVHIISNMMTYDEGGRVTGFRAPLIHTFNKNASVIATEQTFFHRLNGRPNVLLLGDSLGDIHMDVGVENEGTVLKIGFLNFDVENLLGKYEDGYDIVLIQEPSMDLPLSLLTEIHNSFPCPASS